MLILVQKQMLGLLSITLKSGWFPLDSTDPDAPWPKGLLNAALQRFYNPSQSVPTEALVGYEYGLLARGFVRFLTHASAMINCLFPG